VVRRNVELQQLPSLPKRKAPPARGKQDELTVPTIDVMRLRPVRRPGAKKGDAEKDAAEKAARKRPALTKQPTAGGKKIRPGRFLNITALEENPVIDRVSGKAPKPKTGQGHKQAAPVPLPKVFQLYGDLTVAEFAERIHSTPQEIILKAMTLGEMLSINQFITHDLCELIAADLGINIEIVEETDELDVAHVAQAEVSDEDLLSRPPVVTVMGHVDHGKTSLLDAIRKTKVADGEFGGITQHIGAYRVETHRGEIVFLDTPGHAAFTAMRARGASVTDIVILIVAADDGVMPQTIEAINHARAANAPIIVAINKIDKPGANVLKVRNDLMQHSLISEELGGDTIICEVSAKSGIGIDNLLEMIQLQAEIMELKAPQDIRAEGVIIESNVDPQRGITATVLVQTGTLKAGDPFVCGDVSGRVRLMLDDRGHRVEKALPSYPVKILGLDGCPQVGEKFLVLESEREAREIAQVREQRRRRQAQNKGMRPHMTLEGLSSYLSEETKAKDLNIILKADVQGSVEAVSDAMQHLSTEKVSVRILHAAVGGVTETDVQLAMASDAVIIGFNVRPDSTAADLAQQEGIEIKTYRVIYELLEEIASAMLGLLDRTFKEVARGSAEIRQVFKISKFGNVAGCYVTSGTITRNDKMRLVRDGKVVYQGTLATLRRIKDDVKEVQAGYECGMTFTNYNDFKEGDVIEPTPKRKSVRPFDSVPYPRAPRFPLFAGNGARLFNPRLPDLRNSGPDHARYPHNDPRPPAFGLAPASLPLAQGQTLDSQAQPSLPAQTTQPERRRSGRSGSVATSRAGFCHFVNRQNHCGKYPEKCTRVLRQTSRPGSDRSAGRDPLTRSPRPSFTRQGVSAHVAFPNQARPGRIPPRRGQHPRL
jgi:translation initiation factor IF-2